MSVVDAVTLAIALAGLLLGIVNTWHTMDTNRVKLRVAPRVSYSFPRGMDPVTRIGIEVVNRSAFPVTISQLGFLLAEAPGWTGPAPSPRCALVTPIMFDGGTFPRRLEARTAFTAYFNDDFHRKAEFMHATRAYAETSGGDVALSSRRAVWRLRQSLARGAIPGPS